MYLKKDDEYKYFQNLQMLSIRIDDDIDSEIDKYFSSKYKDKNIVILSGEDKEEHY